MSENMEEIQATKLSERAEDQGREQTTQQIGKWSRRSLLIGAAVIVIAGIVAATYWRRGEKPKSETESQVSVRSSADAGPLDLADATDEQMRQISVETVSVRRLEVERETTGKVGLNEERTTPVFTPYAGRVLELNASKGAIVKAGQPLAVIESPELVLAQNDLAGARSDENKARIALDALEKTAERARSLHAREAIAAKDLQQAEAELARAKDELRRSQAAVAYTEGRLALFGKDPSKLSEVSNVSAPDRRVVLRAPINGVIVERKIGAGQYIRPDSQEPLFLISDLSTVWVIADVFENYLANIRVGQPVEISVPAYPDRRFPARVAFINPAVDVDTRTIHVRCSVQNSMGLLKPYMFARIKIGSSSPASVAVVPTGAIFTKGADSFIFVEESPKRFRRRQVTPGREIDDMMIIESGLQAGERVVTRGVLLVNRIIESDGRKG